MPGFYNAEGYYCPDYDTVYYDGYGYNLLGRVMVDQSKKIIKK